MDAFASYQSSALNLAMLALLAVSPGGARGAHTQPSPESLAFTADPGTIEIQPGVEPAPLQIRLVIANQSKIPTRLLTYRTFKPCLVDSQGKPLLLHEQSDRSRVVSESDCHQTGPGKEMHYRMSGTVYWYQGNRRLEFQDGAGGVLFFDGLAPGEYRLSLVYVNQTATVQIVTPNPKQITGFWTGELRSSEIKLVIKT